MTRISKLLIAAAASTVLGGTAFADDPPADGTEGGEAPAGDGTGSAAVAPDAAAPMAGAYTKTTWPTELNARPLTFAKGLIQVHVDAFVNLTSSRAFKPVAIAPDIYYGVSDKLTVGLTHNLGLCLAGTDNGCGKVYNDVGLDALFQLKRDAKMDLAFHGGLDFLALDPLTVGLRVGVSFKYVTGKIGIFADPALKLGLNKRDGVVDPMTMISFGGNKETLSIPIMVTYQVDQKLAPYVRTGLGGLGLSGPNAGAPLDGFGDGFVIPLGVGALFAMSNKLDLGAEFIFPGIIGSNVASADARYINLFVNFRL